MCLNLSKCCKENDIDNTHPEMNIWDIMIFTSEADLSFKAERKMWTKHTVHLTKTL